MPTLPVNQPSAPTVGVGVDGDVGSLSVVSARGLGEPSDIFSHAEALRGRGVVRTGASEPAKIVFGRRRVAPRPAFGLPSERVVRVGYALSLGEIETVRFVWSSQHERRVPMGRGRVIIRTWYGTGAQTPQYELGLVPLASWNATGVFDDGGYVAAQPGDPDPQVDLGDLEARLLAEDADSLPWSGQVVVNGQLRNVNQFASENQQISSTAPLSSHAGNQIAAFLAGSEEGNSRASDVVAAGLTWAGIGVVMGIVSGGAITAASVIGSFFAGAGSRVSELYVAEPLGRSIGESSLGRTIGGWFGRDADDNSVTPNPDTTFGRISDLEGRHAFDKPGTLPGVGEPPGSRGVAATTVGSLDQDVVGELDPDTPGSSVIGNRGQFVGDDVDLSTPEQAPGDVTPALPGDPTVDPTGGEGLDLAPAAPGVTTGTGVADTIGTAVGALVGALGEGQDFTTGIGGALSPEQEFLGNLAGDTVQHAAQEAVDRVNQFLDQFPGLSESERTSAQINAAHAAAQRVGAIFGAEAHAYITPDGQLGVIASDVPGVVSQVVSQLPPGSVLPTPDEEDEEDSPDDPGGIDNSPVDPGSGDDDFGGEGEPVE